jgi:hypothetical protein
MYDPHFLSVAVVMLAVFGPVFYIIYLTGKLIRYRIDKKYKAQSGPASKEMQEFRERTEHRLRVLEEIIAESDEMKLSAKQKSRLSDSAAEHGYDSISPDEHTETESQKNRLRNQLKS